MKKDGGGELQGYLMPVYDIAQQRQDTCLLANGGQTAIFPTTAGSTTAMVPLATAFPTTPAAFAANGAPIYSSQVLYSSDVSSGVMPAANAVTPATGQLQQIPVATYPMGYSYSGFNGYWGQTMTAYYVPQQAQSLTNAVATAAAAPLLTATPQLQAAPTAPTAASMTGAGSVTFANGLIQAAPSVAAAAAAAAAAASVPTAAVPPTVASTSMSAFNNNNRAVACAVSHASLSASNMAAAAAAYQGTPYAGTTYYGVPRFKRPTTATTYYNSNSHKFMAAGGISAANNAAAATATYQLGHTMPALTLTAPAAAGSLPPTDAAATTMYAVPQHTTIFPANVFPYATTMVAAAAANPNINANAPSTVVTSGGGGGGVNISTAINQPATHGTNATVPQTNSAVITPYYSSHHHQQHHVPPPTAHTAAAPPTAVAPVLQQLHVPMHSPGPAAIPIIDPATLTTTNTNNNNDSVSTQSQSQAPQQQQQPPPQPTNNNSNNNSSSSSSGITTSCSSTTHSAPSTPHLPQSTHLTTRAPFFSTPPNTSTNYNSVDTVSATSMSGGYIIYPPYDKRNSNALPYTTTNCFSIKKQPLLCSSGVAGLPPPLNRTNSLNVNSAGGYIKQPLLTLGVDEARQSILNTQASSYMHGGGNSNVSAATVNAYQEPRHFTPNKRTGPEKQPLLGCYPTNYNVAAAAAAAAINMPSNAMGTSINAQYHMSPGTEASSSTSGNSNSNSNNSGSGSGSKPPIRLNIAAPAFRQKGHAIEYRRNLSQRNSQSPATYSSSNDSNSTNNSPNGAASSTTITNTATSSLMNATNCYQTSSSNNSSASSSTFTNNNNNNNNSNSSTSTSNAIAVSEQQQQQQHVPIPSNTNTTPHYMTTSRGVAHIPQQMLGGTATNAAAIHGKPPASTTATTGGVSASDGQVLVHHQQPLLSTYNSGASGVYFKYGQTYFTHPSVVRRSPSTELRPSITPMTSMYPTMNMMMTAPLRHTQTRHINPNYKGTRPR